MTLEQLEEELPNGLHDAQIRSITRNFENGTLMLALHIHVGLLDDPPEERERYRNGMITFSGVEDSWLRALRPHPPSPRLAGCGSTLAEVKWACFRPT